MGSEVIVTRGFASLSTSMPRCCPINVMSDVTGVTISSSRSTFRMPCA